MNPPPVHNRVPLYRIHSIDLMSITNKFHRHNLFRQRNLQLQPGNVVLNRHKCAYYKHVIGMTSWDRTRLGRALCSASLKQLVHIMVASTVQASMHHASRYGHTTMTTFWCLTNHRVVFVRSHYDYVLLRSYGCLCMFSIKPCGVCV